MTLHCAATIAVDRDGLARPRLAEHSLVRTLKDITEGDLTIPAGSVGVIVFVHKAIDAYEVEFFSPVVGVVGVHRDELSPED